MAHPTVRGRLPLNSSVRSHMSDSFAILPLRADVRDWLASEGHEGLPSIDGRAATLAEVKSTVASLQDVTAEWSINPQFPDAFLSTASGLRTTLIIGGVTDDGMCEFHFRGGDAALVESVVNSLSKIVGPLVIYAHSGSFTKVVHAPGRGT